MKKHYEEKLWDYLAKNLSKEDARKVWHYISKSNSAVLRNYMLELKNIYTRELKMNPDSPAIDDCALGIAIVKEVLNRFVVHDKKKK